MGKRIALQVAGWYALHAVPVGGVYALHAVPVGGVYEALIFLFPNIYLSLVLLTYLEYTNNKHKRSPQNNKKLASFYTHQYYTR